MPGTTPVNTPPSAVELDPDAVMVPVTPRGEPLEDVPEERLDEVATELAQAGIGADSASIDEDISEEALEDILVAEGPGVADPVRMYLREIGRVHLLDARKEVDLAIRIQRGDGELERKQRGEEVDQALIDDGMEARQRADRGQSSAGRFRCQEIYRPGDDAPRSRPRRKYRADSCGGEVRSHQGVPLLTYATWWIGRPLLARLPTRHGPFGFPSTWWRR